jgi:hypothetical protein
MFPIFECHQIPLKNRSHGLVEKVRIAPVLTYSLPAKATLSPIFPKNCSTAPELGGVSHSAIRHGKYQPLLSLAED